MCGGGGGCGQVLGTVGTVMSFIPGLQPIGMALSAGSMLLGALSSSKSGGGAMPVPAAPAPQPMVSGGAKVTVGSDAASRVAAPGYNAANPNAGGNDPLGNLGRGGLIL